jgi:aldose 1-epimerase
VIRLAHGALELLLAPEVGGAVAAFRVDGRNLLRPAPEASKEVLSMAAFPLVPFAGRIHHGCFEFNGRHVRLPANFAPEPHAIHGHGWQQPWRVERVTATSATLVYEHTADAWPWPYTARQHFALDDHGLTLDLELVNVASAPMPAGLGWHPYFPRRDARLTADVSQCWPSGGEAGISAPVALTRDTDLRGWLDVATLSLDDTFSAGSGGAQLGWPDRHITLEAGRVSRFLVVYVPMGRDFFCVEPVSHVPGALHDPGQAAATGLEVLSAGARLTERIRLTVRA